MQLFDRVLTHTLEGLPVLDRGRLLLAQPAELIILSARYIMLGTNPSPLVYQITSTSQTLASVGPLERSAARPQALEPCPTSTPFPPAIDQVLVENHGKTMENYWGKGKDQSNRTQYCIILRLSVADLNFA